MAIALPPLPYAENALEPHYSAKTISFHYGKHHKTYVDNINKLIAGTPLENKSIEEIVKASAGDSAKAGMFNNSAQVWNHTFFWNCMKPGGGGGPQGELARKIDTAFGGYEKFAEQFKATAVGRFGSGWGWLVMDGTNLKIVSTSNAETPMAANQTALLTVDVWEHAYYLDYQNRRPDFVQAFLDHLVNWDFVAANLGAAK
ncbi:MAG TPA: superoxide dismutase [Candidatus Baltobacteraceae bacterium]|nr:superoxide dismutase [Candidatus Baltobacteraceae bacterium]